MYVDVVFIENFIIDYFLIFITSKILQKEIRRLMSIFAASIGGIYSVLYLSINISCDIKILLALLVAFFMIRLSFEEIHFMIQIRNVAMFLIATFILAGLCLFIQNQTPEFNYKKLFIAMILVYIFIKKIVKNIVNKKELSSLVFKVEIINCGLIKEVNAFFDTGNGLKEPVTGLPVLIVEEDIFYCFSKKNEKHYLIPYRLIDGNIGQLLGFKPEYILIDINNKKQKKKVIMACCNTVISPVNEYNALLSRGII